MEKCMNCGEEFEVNDALERCVEIVSEVIMCNE